MESNNTLDNQGAKGSFQQTTLSFLWEIFKIAVIALIIVLPIRYFLFQPFIVKGESMAPNLESGDYLIIDEISYRFSDLQRGDIVVFNYPKDPSQRFIKRVIGLPGETISVNNGQVQVTTNGQAVTLDESYLPEGLQTSGSITITLSNGEYFVMGDNRQFSYDSRAWGTVERNDIIGKAFLRLFPINDLSYITRPAYQLNQ